MLQQLVTLFVGQSGQIESRTAISISQLAEKIFSLFNSYNHLSCAASFFWRCKPFPWPTASQVQEYQGPVLTDSELTQTAGIVVRRGHRQPADFVFVFRTDQVIVQLGTTCTCARNEVTTGLTTLSMTPWGCSYRYSRLLCWWPSIWRGKTSWLLLFWCSGNSLNYRSTQHGRIWVVFPFHHKSRIKKNYKITTSGGKSHTKDHPYIYNDLAWIGLFVPSDG